MKQFVVIFSLKVPQEYPSSLQGWVNPLEFHQPVAPQLEE